jgi:hypothetical protein
MTVCEEDFFFALIGLAKSGDSLSHEDLDEFSFDFPEIEARG